MIREFFVCPKTIERLETSPLAKEIRSLAEDLTRQGYTRKSIRSYLTMCDLLGRWLARNNIPLEEFCDDTIERFASAPPEQRGGTRKNWRGAVLSSARVLLRHLRTTGVVKEMAPDPSADDAHHWLAAFDHYLDQVKGLKVETRKQYQHYANRFLEELEKEGRIDWSLVTAEVFGDSGGPGRSREAPRRDAPWMSLADGHGYAFFSPLFGCAKHFAFRN
ncbi:MAG: hypothetical protein IT343_19125 [Candidatus Melainabacteria bacterium]|nr:hypothetical protein [Candidatus Melainabacteria bacterium]